jgi:hypothetical protein
MLADVSGTRDGVDWPRRGTVAELPDGEARDLITAGIAAEHVEEPAVETATSPRRPASK